MGAAYARPIQIFASVAISICFCLDAKAHGKTALACEISDTVGLKFINHKWQPWVFPPGDFMLGNQKKFVLGLENGAITQESAKPLFASSFADCKSRADVGATFCDDPMGDGLIYYLDERVGSLTSASGVNGFRQYPDGTPANELHISIFKCSPF